VAKEVGSKRNLEIYYLSVTRVSAIGPLLL
jgi:hypothetical protein